MLSTLFKYTAATLGEATTQVGNVASYVWDDITSIPDAIKQGWDEELFTATPAQTEPAQPAQVTPTLEQIQAKIAELQAMLPTEAAASETAA